MDKSVFDSITVGSWEKRFFNYMRLVGLERVQLSYSGGGDSGGVDEISFIPGTVSDKITNGIKEDFEEILSNPIYNRHGGFADGGGYHVDGIVDYNATNNTVYISGTDHNTEYNYNEEEEDYEENNSWAEEWEECVYESKDDNSKQVDFEFAYVYARDVLKGKYPEEIHNRILAEAATNQNEWAEKYISEF